MKFNEMLTYWNLKGAVRDASTDNPHNDWKKIKVRLDPNHSVFIRYNKAGPLGATLYFDNGLKFQMEERIGVTVDATADAITDLLNMWMKDLV